MRAATIALTILCFLSTGLGAPLRAQSPAGGPCAQITADAIVGAHILSAIACVLIYLMRTSWGKAVAFQPNGPNIFLADLVVKRVDWGEDGKGLFDPHLHHCIDRILPTLSAP